MPALGIGELAVALSWSLVAAFAFVLGRRLRHRQVMRARLATLNLNVHSDLPARAAYSPRVIAIGLGQRVGGRYPGQVEKLRRDIDASGLAGRIAAEELLGWKFGLAAVGLLFGLGLLKANVLFGTCSIPVLFATGWCGPSFWLAQCRSSRMRQIVRDLPTVIDLLALSLHAGMGLDRAMRVVSERVDSPLSDELRRVLTDTSLGISRQEAFGRLSTRTGSDDVRSLSTNIIQSEQLGTSLVSTINNQAQQVRQVRRRRAEAQAMKAPVKMLLPMVLFILPTLFLIVLGPPALNVGLAMARGHP